MRSPPMLRPYMGITKGAIQRPHSRDTLRQSQHKHGGKKGHKRVSSHGQRPVSQLFFFLSFFLLVLFSNDSSKTHPAEQAE